jgi:hypothetical protein
MGSDPALKAAELSREPRPGIKRGEEAVPVTMHKVNVPGDGGPEFRVEERAAANIRKKQDVYLHLSAGREPTIQRRMILYRPLCYDA